MAGIGRAVVDFNGVIKANELPSSSSWTIHTRCDDICPPSYSSRQYLASSARSPAINDHLQHRHLTQTSFRPLLPVIHTENVIRLSSCGNAESAQLKHEMLVADNRHLCPQSCLSPLRHNPGNIGSNHRIANVNFIHSLTIIIITLRFVMESKIRP